MSTDRADRTKELAVIAQRASHAIVEEDKGGKCHSDIDTTTLLTNAMASQFWSVHEHEQRRQDGNIQLRVPAQFDSFTMASSGKCQLVFA